MTKKLLPFALPVLLLLFWWGITETGSVPALLLPGPAAVAERFMTLLASGELLHHAATSMPVSYTHPTLPTTFVV